MYTQQLIHEFSLPLKFLEVLCALRGLVMVTAAQNKGNLCVGTDALPCNIQLDSAARVKPASANPADFFAGHVTGRGDRKKQLGLAEELAKAHGEMPHRLPSEPMALPRQQPMLCDSLPLPG